jgi:hypothetical protein
MRESRIDGVAPWRYGIAASEPSDRFHPRPHSLHWNRKQPEFNGPPELIVHPPLIAGGVGLKGSSTFSLKAEFLKNSKSFASLRIPRVKNLI